MPNLLDAIGRSNTGSYLGAVRNRGAEAAQEQCVLFMDDVNIAIPHEVETFMSPPQHNGADVLTCASAVFSETPPAELSYVWLPLGDEAGACYLGRALRMAAGNPLRAQFLAACRNQRLREAVKCALVKANRLRLS